MNMKSRQDFNPDGEIEDDIENAMETEFFQRMGEEKRIESKNRLIQAGHDEIEHVFRRLEDENLKAEEDLSVEGFWRE